MSKKDLSLDFDCPTCGANPQEVCELISGQPRFASHVERYDIARDRLRGLEPEPGFMSGKRKGVRSDALMREEATG